MKLLADRTTLVLRGPSGAVIAERELYPKPDELLEVSLPR